MKTLKVNLVAVIAVLICLGTMSFRLAENVTENETALTPLWWYINVGVDEWELEEPSEGARELPTATCREEVGPPCVKGFLTPQIPENINDDTDAFDEFFHEL